MNKIVKRLEKISGITSIQVLDLKINPMPHIKIEVSNARSMESDLSKIYEILDEQQGINWTLTLTP